MVELSNTHRVHRLFNSDLGDSPVQRLNALENELRSLKPTSKAIWVKLVLGLADREMAFSNLYRSSRVRKDSDCALSFLVKVLLLI